MNSSSSLGPSTRLSSGWSDCVRAGLVDVRCSWWCPSSVGACHLLLRRPRPETTIGVPADDRGQGRRWSSSGSTAAAPARRSTAAADRHRPQRRGRVDDEQHRPAGHRAARRRRVEVVAPEGRLVGRAQLAQVRAAPRRPGQRRPGPAGRPRRGGRPPTPVSCGEPAGGQVDDDLGTRRPRRAPLAQQPRRRRRARRAGAGASRANIARDGLAPLRGVGEDQGAARVVRLVGAGSGRGSRRRRRATSCAARARAPRRAAAAVTAAHGLGRRRARERLRQPRRGRPSTGRTARRRGRRATPAAAP